MKVNVNPVKGMRDFLPKEKEIRDYLETSIVNTYKQNGFQLIETPVVENIDRLLGSKGGDNLKLIYKIMKRGEKLNFEKENLKEIDLSDLGLRYDLTIPLSRFYCNNRSKLPAIFKSLQVGNVFRAERQQKGRYRSFKQCDIDIIGDDSISAEIELITTTAKALTALNFNDFIVRINDRQILKNVVLNCGFSEDVYESVCVTLDKLDKIQFDGVEKELNKKGFDAENISNIIDALTVINDKGLNCLSSYGVDEKVIDNLSKIISIVSEFVDKKYDIVFDFTLVRGMGYYTGTIFEIAYKDLGYSIAGGGRYDEMIGNFIGEKIPAIGFSIGFERLANQLIEENFIVPDIEKAVLLYDVNKDDYKSVLKKAESLRNDSVSINILPKGKKISKQLSQLKDSGYVKFAIYDDNDIILKELE